MAKLRVRTPASVPQALQQQAPWQQASS